MFRNRLILSYAFEALVLTALFLSSGCSHPRQTPEQRANAAKQLFDQTTKQFHNASAEAKGPEKATLQDKAAAGYEELLKKYPEQSYYAAQALRNLAGIRAEQGKIDAALKLYASVEKKYPKEDWQVLMAWKAGADLLWEHNRKDEARYLYRNIVNTFDKPDAPQVVKTVVRGSKRRLAGKDIEGGGSEPGTK